MVLGPSDGFADGSNSFMTVRSNGIGTRHPNGTASVPSSTSQQPAHWEQRRRFAPAHRSSPSEQSDPYLLSKHDRRWRWWHVVFAVFAALCLVQVAVAFVGGTLIGHKLRSVRIDIREYPALKYLDLDSVLAAQTGAAGLDGRLSVYHVTKEFGAASMGGMGMVVTAMTTALERTGNVDVAIVMPFYSFLRDIFEAEKVADLAVNVNQGQQQVPVEFSVWKTTHRVTQTLAGNSSSLLDPTSNGTASSSSVQHDTGQFPVYLIGPGSIRPFERAFRANNIVDIYSSPDGLPQEWKDQFFNKAVAEFLAHQSTASNPAAADIVHVHGATNAYTMKHLRDRYAPGGKLYGRGKEPAILYTLHDYLDEPQYTIRTKNVAKFLDAPDPELSARYTRGKRVFMSSLGIDYADVVTFVSRAMAIDMVEGHDDFYLKELLMDSILRKAQQGRFFGITNGVDYGALDPFTNGQLVSNAVSFPQYAEGMLRRQHRQQQQHRNQPMVWQLPRDMSDYVSFAKDQAKRYLTEQGILSESDLARPLILYVGRFQYNKGLEMFDDAARMFAERDAKLLVIGQPNNYPLRWVEDLQKRYPAHVTVMSTDEEQRSWLVLCRAAADFVFVPSLTESFGLVAAEGLLFGAPVISTGAGGLKEFLVDRAPTHHASPTREDRRPIVSVFREDSDDSMKTVVQSPKLQHNAYLFEAFETQSLEAAINDAIEDYRYIHKDNVIREELVLRMIHDAFNLGWSRGDGQGPVQDYIKAYSVARHSRQ